MSLTTLYPDSDRTPMYPMTNLWGKYRGKVVGVSDPDGRGRVQVEVLGLLEGSPAPWAMPCLPYAAANVGVYAIPPVGANVWVEFESGDIHRPIWTGCFWDRGSVRAPGEARRTAGATEQILLETNQCLIALDDSAGGSIRLKLRESNSEIVLTGDSIELSCQGKSVKLSSASVLVNSGSLEVV